MTVPQGVTSDKGPIIPVRYIQTILLFLGIVSVYFGRINIGVSVVAMTNAATTNPDFMEFDWNEMEKSYILSSFYWGYVFTQFPGGFMCHKYGAKVTMLISTLGSTLLTLIIPEVVKIGGWQAFCAIRFAQGLFQGLLFPCIHGHLAKWAPKQERTLLGGLSHSGLECGTVLAMGVSGLIAASSLGWPGISYVAGGVGLVWCVLWILLGSNSPATCSYISAEELKYIESTVDREDSSAKKIPTPWKAIATSVPMLALLFTRCSEAWGFTTMLAELPAYMNGVLMMDIKANALFSALPYVVMWAMSYFYVFLANFLLQRKFVTLSVLRKTYNSIAFWIPAAALIGVGYVSVEQKALAIALITINVGVNSAATIGSSLNTLDLAPNHSAMLMGITNTIANLVPIMTPITVGLVVKDEHDRHQWQIVFLIAAAIFIVGNIVFITFGSTDAQPWNFPKGTIVDAEKSDVTKESPDPTEKNADESNSTDKPKEEIAEC